jgi:hypothetical protein
MNWGESHVHLATIFKRILVKVCLKHHFIVVMVLLAEPLESQKPGLLHALCFNNSFENWLKPQLV